jgi:DNA-binding response OmpR family regulator
MAHVLVIDDDELVRIMLTQMLHMDTHRVTVAADGEAGLRLAFDVKPDLVIMDMLMPLMDGIESIMAMAAAGMKAPIIAISGGRRAISAEFNLESAAMMGVKATLAKPFAIADLRKAVKLALA